MAVYLTRTCALDGPDAPAIRRFDTEHLLDWFVERWSDGLYEHPDTLGAFADIASAIRAAPPPASIPELHERLVRYGSDAVEVSEHLVRTRYTMLDVDYHFHLFDDRWRAENPELTGYLLHDWALPTSAPAAPGGHAHFVDRTASFTEGPLQSFGLRTTLHDASLADLVRWVTEEPDEVTGSGLRELAEALREPPPGIDATERELWAGTAEARLVLDDRWRETRGCAVHVSWLAAALPRCSPDPEAARVQVDEHFAQASLPVETRMGPGFRRWILFDDVWAAAHPELARGILLERDGRG